MKKVVLIIVLCCLLLPVLTVKADTIATVDLQIFDNKGLSQYSRTNFTFDCEAANSNILTVIVNTKQGVSYLTISHKVEGVFIEQDFSILDRVGNIYNVQFTGDNIYRLRVTNEYDGSVIYDNYYINVIGGAGVYVGGTESELVKMGEWVKTMMFIYGFTSYDDFLNWADIAFKWYSNPAYIVTDFLIQVPMLLVLPQTWLLLVIISIIIVYKYRKRIHNIRKERELTKKYGQRQNIILENRKKDEQLRLRKLNTMPLDSALEMYGDGEIKSRATCYALGETDMGIQYTTAFSLAFELGGALFSEDERRSKKADEIIERLVDKHEPILEKAIIYRDIAACARAIAGESVEAETKTIIRDDFIRIAGLAEEKAKTASEEFSKKLKIRGKEEESISKTVSDIEKSLTAKKEVKKDASSKSK